MPHRPAHQIAEHLAGGAAAGAGAGAAAAAPSYAVGAKVESQAVAGGAWHPAVVTAAHGDGTLSVRFIGLPGGASHVRDAADVRPLGLPPRGVALAEEEIKPGRACVAKYAADGQWYPAREWGKREAGWGAGLGTLLSAPWAASGGCALVGDVGTMGDA